MDRQTFTRLMGSLQQIINSETNSRMEALKSAQSDAAPNEPAVQLLNHKFSDLQTLGVLGSGTFGRVTLVQHRGN